jgi:hypothetical protein
MPTCVHCGEEIEFRYIDGRSTPIHIHGGWCVGFDQKMSVKGQEPYRSPEAFTDPNALCPVCGATVFYYQNSFGSRVFFDDLGWPWPKHRCTDSPASQTGKIKRPAKTRHGRAVAFANFTTIYELVKIKQKNGIIRLKFRNIKNRLIVRNIQFLTEEFENQGWEKKDLKEAPSFIIRSDSGKTVVEFISVRRGIIGNLVFDRTAAKGNPK